MKTNKIIGVVILILVIVGALWYLIAGGALKGVDANAAVATVNGAVITRGQLLASEADIASQQGLSATSTAVQAEFQSQALDLLIGQTLIKQAAQQAGVTASTTLVDAALAAAKAQFSTPAAYEQALASHQMTEADLRSQLSDDYVINTFLGQQLNLASTTATNAEIQAAYNAVASEQQGGSSPVPPLSQVRDQVAQSVVRQKQQDAINAYVAQLRAGADVKILIATSTATQ